MNNTGSTGESKFYTGPITQRQAEEYLLPAGYGEDRLVLMPRDPYWIFAYWEVTPATVEKVKEASGGVRLHLRLYDVTNIIFNGQNAWKSLDTEVTGDNWYLNVPDADCTYLAELGYFDRQGNFVPLIRSNAVRTPRDRPSDARDEEWLAVDYEELYKLSGGYSVGKGSEEMRELFSRGRRVREEFSSPGIPGISSWK